MTRLFRPSVPTETGGWVKRAGESGPLVSEWSVHSCSLVDFGLLVGGTPGTSDVWKVSSLRSLKRPTL